MTLWFCTGAYRNLLRCHSGLILQGGYGGSEGSRGLRNLDSGNDPDNELYSNYRIRFRVEWSPLGRCPSVPNDEACAVLPQSIGTTAVVPPRIFIVITFNRGLQPSRELPIRALIVRHSRTWSESFTVDLRRIFNGRGPSYPIAKAIQRLLSSCRS